MSFFTDKHILLLFAHPDDEVIFGWPILQEADCEKELAICSAHDENRPALREVAGRTGCRLSLLGGPNQFYAFSETTGESQDFYQRIQAQIAAGGYDFVFTHNPEGEYGHLDHKFVFDAAVHSIRPVVYSDILYHRGRPSTMRRSMIIRHAWYRDPPIAACKLKSLGWYHDLQKLYEDRGWWTWNAAPIQECNLHIMRP